MTHTPSDGIRPVAFWGAVQAPDCQPHYRRQRGQNVSLPHMPAPGLLSTQVLRELAELLEWWVPVCCLHWACIERMKRKNYAGSENTSKRKSYASGKHLKHCPLREVSDAHSEALMDYPALQAPRRSAYGLVITTGRVNGDNGQPTY
eukprot:1145678-Pelagomonas_calceolata.AAC.1